MSCAHGEENDFVNHTHTRQHTHAHVYGITVHRLGGIEMLLWGTKIQCVMCDVCVCGVLYSNILLFYFCIVCMHSIVRIVVVVKAHVRAYCFVGQKMICVK